MRLSVIISTYNSTEWLEKVIWGYGKQIFTDFELLVADDGSGPETSMLISDMKRTSTFPIHHVWHEDKGFRKCPILNKAVAASEGAYLVFSDGDCIPREDFLLRHYQGKRENCFLSGGTVRLPLELSRYINVDHISSQEAFSKQWLRGKSLKMSFLKGLKLTKRESVSTFMNMITPTRATWNGGNSSAWKKDVLSVNGFDERMRYGAEDREFGERLMNKGLRGIQVRYSAVCIHLDHSRGYVNEEGLRMNAQIRARTRKTRNTWTDFGIVKKSGLE